MTQLLDIANRALQVGGTRTNMSSAEFSGNTSNEAIQTNLIILKLRDELNRMAPWDCTTKFANMTYITSQPTTPENAAAGLPFWQPGIPAPPWAYEYQYPVDCLRARFVMPQYTALSGGTPIYPPGTATGANSIGWTGPATKFKVSLDSFYGATAAAVVGGGTGYSVGNLITLVQPTYTYTQNYPPLNSILTPQTVTMNVGAPAVLQVTSVAGGVITGVTPVNQVQGENESPSGATTQILSGSYYQAPTNPVAQAFATGANGEFTAGSGATFNLTMSSSPSPQRVILTNQETPILCYNQLITDPNVMDPLFQDAWVHILAARLSFQLSGDKALANSLIGLANNMIMEARKADGNEGITKNDVTPDFIRIRGVWGGPGWESSFNGDFDWGDCYAPY